MSITEYQHNISKTNYVLCHIQDLINIFEISHEVQSVQKRFNVSDRKSQ